MKWISFKDRLPDKCISIKNSNLDGHFLVTDGVNIYCAYINKCNDLCVNSFYPHAVDNDLEFHSDIGEIYSAVEKRLTHWCYFNDIKFPNQPERLSEKTSKDDAIV